jgi:hypothetical protein
MGYSRMIHLPWPASFHTLDGLPFYIHIYSELRPQEKEKKSRSGKFARDTREGRLPNNDAYHLRRGRKKRGNKNKHGK